MVIMMALNTGVQIPMDMKINLYGYALDLIEPGDTGYDTVTLGNERQAGVIPAIGMMKRCGYSWSGGSRPQWRGL